MRQRAAPRRDHARHRSCGTAITRHASFRSCAWHHAAHSWDFVSLTQHRPAWDIVVWLLSIVGLVMSVSGVVVGWRRLRR
ncbi:hypothetical protein GA566_09810 [Cupriavidus sp. SW-Y-13]|nr:hypothetical protein [Cupriavidus sp. SW-Y-13]